MALIQKIQQEVPAVAQAATGTTPLAEANDAGRVTSVSYVPTADVTGAASPDSRTLTLVNKGQSGGGSTVIATLALVGGVDLTANDEKAITLTSTVADRAVAAGDVLAWTSTAVTSGGGLADPGGVVQVEIGDDKYTDVPSSVGTIAQTQS